MPDYLTQHKQESAELQKNEQEIATSYEIQVYSNTLKAAEQYRHVFPNGKINFLAIDREMDEREEIWIQFDENGKAFYNIPRKGAFSPEQLITYLGKPKTLEQAEKNTRAFYQSFRERIKSPLGQHLAEQALQGLEEKILSINTPKQLEFSEANQ